MKNCVYKDYRGELNNIGYLEDVLWKETSYCGGPKKSESFLLTADGKGNTNSMSCVVGREDVQSMFEDIVVSHYYGDVTIYDGTEERELTNDDLIKLYRMNRIWYDIDVDRNDCGGFDNLTIYEGNAIPKYFLDTELKGPIDSEIESNESVQVDLDFKPV